MFLLETEINGVRFYFEDDYGQYKLSRNIKNAKLFVDEDEEFLKLVNNNILNIKFSYTPYKKK